MKVLDKDGKELKEQKLEAKYVNKELVLNAAGQEAGNYTVVLTAKSGEKKQKLH